MSLADYALQVAIQMENLGRTFYKSLASGSGNAAVSILANKLAGEEEKHMKVFEDMRNLLPADERGPKMTEDQIAATAGKFYKLILPSPEEVRQVAVSGDAKGILKLAMQMESDSIAYYSNMVSTVGSSVGVLKAVIKEEEKHLAILREIRNRF